MICKNCGAQLDEGVMLCPNCNTKIEQNDAFSLIAEDENEPKQSFEKEQSIDTVMRKRQKRGMIAFSIFTIVLLICSAVFPYMYFSDKLSKQEDPVLEFTSGCGVINKNEQVVYAGFVDSAIVQYIQGVELYNESDGKPVGDIISADYEYTQSIDNSFRVIYFDAENLDIGPSDTASLVFVIKLSVYGDDNIYTYYQNATFDYTTTTDISDIVFDHSQDVDVTVTLPKEQTTRELPTRVTTTIDISFVFEGYWYAPVVDDGETKSITVYQFIRNDERDCNITRYTLDNNGNWTKQVKKKSQYLFENGQVIVTNAITGMSDVYDINGLTKKLYKQTSEDDAELKHLEHNSQENAEDLIKQ